MARPLRIQYPGAIYHAFNRGNYRRDVFGETGAAHAFVTTLEEAVDRFGWRIGAYVVMRNHYHLAIQTPEPNLAIGMHWLQGTFATRFNRFRKEQGHLFQGRYRAILLESDHDWARVVDYIHLNPVRAGLIPPERVAQFRWSSLNRYYKNQRFNGLTTLGWMRALGLEDLEKGWIQYGERLIRRANSGAELLEAEHRELTSGWAIGSDAWKESTVLPQVRDREFSGAGGSKRVPVDLLAAKWNVRLRQEIRALGKTEMDLLSNRKGAGWKIELAERLQRELGVSVSWLADALKMGKASSARAYLWKARKNSHITA